MNDLVSVTLTGPAKISGERKIAGATVAVPIKLALELAASGVINADTAKSLSDAMQDMPLVSDFEAAVAAEVAVRMAKASEDAANDQVRIVELDLKCAQALDDLSRAEVKLVAAQDHIAELEGQLFALKSSTPPPAGDGEQSDKPKPQANSSKAPK